MADKVRLREATKLGQLVSGTGSGAVYVCIALCAGLKLAIKCPPGGFHVTLRAEPDTTGKFLHSGAHFVEALGMSIQDCPSGNYASSHLTLASGLETAMLIGATLAAFEQYFSSTPICKGCPSTEKTLRPLDVIERLKETA